MTEKEMQDYSELFDDDGNDPIYYVWDERSGDKRLLCASHDVATVCKFILNSPILSEDQKVRARILLDMFVSQIEAEGLPRLEWVN